jgi:hypothetical protein
MRPPTRIKSRSSSKNAEVGLDRLAPAIAQDVALQRVEQALAGSGWIEVATHGEQVAYQVAVNEEGEYEILGC